MSPRQAPAGSRGREQAAGRLAGFDAAVERRVERLRGRPTLDRMFYAASELADFSLLWHLVSTARATAPDRRPVHAVRLAAILGAESLLVNGVIKSLFRRGRPSRLLDHPHPLRQPRTSSFPSGHASAAMVAAYILAERDPLWPAYLVLAAVVATSRVYVGMHHASDVVAGALLGIALARLGRRAWPLPEM